MSAQGGATGSVHVNVFGGPGSGKSTMAYGVAAELKARGYTAECVGEVVKDCIYDAARGDQEAARLLDGSVESQEELYRRQSARERRLDGLVQFVVADSPAIMGLAYLAPDADEDRAARLAALAQDEFEAQESVNGRGRTTPAPGYTPRTRPRGSTRTSWPLSRGPRRGGTRRWAAATRARLRRWPSSTAWQRGPEMMNYDELYRELERDAREAGLEKEHLEWQLGLEGWAKDPVAVAMRDWRLQHAPETLEGKSEEQVGREMAMVHLLAESRRTAAAQAWMRSPQSSQAKDAQQKAALMNAAAAAENEAMISEIPDIAISL